MSAHSLTKPEIALLDSYLSLNPTPPLDLFFDYQREEYHFVAYPLNFPGRTLAHKNAIARLIARRILIENGYLLYLHPDHFETLYGNTFTLTVAKIIDREWKREISARDEIRANLDAAQAGTLSSYRVDLLWELYTSKQTHTQQPESVVNARHASWIACGKQALAFFHYACDAFTNSERSLQALERLTTWIDLKGYYWLVARDTRLTF